MFVTENNTHSPEDLEGDDLATATQISDELAQAVGASNDVSKALVTLEAIAAAIEAAPELSTMEARVVNAAIERFNAQYELPCTSLGLESAANPRQAALEDIASKVESFKKVVGAIIDKIIELIGKFWEWLTLNGKSLKERLKKLETSLKSQTKDVELPVTGAFKALSNEDGLSATTATDVGATLYDLIPRVAIFLGKTAGRLSHLNSEQEVLKAIASDLKDLSNKDGSFTFYENMGGRSLKMAVNPELTGSRGSLKKIPYETKIFPAENPKALPDTIKLTAAQALELVQGALAIIELCEKHIASVQSLARKMKGDVVRIGNTLHGRWTANAFAGAVSVFIDGVFTQSLRYGAGIAALGNAYMKQADETVIDAT